MATIQEPTKTERLQARVNTETKAMIERAAHVRGVSVSDFVINAAYEAATDTLEAHETLHLRQQDSHVFFEAIMNPPEANDAFQKAAKRYQQAMKPTP
jgi:uncharacterized protein (DUF1778 family)